MNPLLIAQAAQSTKSFFSNRKVQIVLLVIVLYFIFKKKIKRLIHNIKQRRFDKNEAQDVNQIAQQYRSAANPSGISWMINADGTDEREIERLGYQSKGKLQPIADAYRLKFEQSLSDRLRKELSPKEFQDWRNIVD
jgi:pyruvate-formate lyase-activating enzyme